MSIESEYVWKVVVVGDGGVGKTTLVFRYMKNLWIPNLKETIGAEFHSKIVEYKGHKINMVLWDIAGQEKFKDVRKEHIRGCDCAIVMYDMTRMNTLFNVPMWVEMIRESSSSNAPILLVGGKYDAFFFTENETTNDKERKLLDDDFKKVKKAAEVIKEKLKLNGAIITSSKTGENVSETILYAIDLIAYNYGFW